MDDKYGTDMGTEKCIRDFSWKTLKQEDACSLFCVGWTVILKVIRKDVRVETIQLSATQTVLP